MWHFSSSYSWSQQDEYEGLIQISRASNTYTATTISNHNKSLNGDSSIIHEDDEKKSPHTTPNGKKQQQQQLVYRFGISDIVEKKEALQSGDKVLFWFENLIFIWKTTIWYTHRYRLLQHKNNTLNGRFVFSHLEGY